LLRFSPFPYFFVIGWLACCLAKKSSFFSVQHPADVVAKKDRLLLQGGRLQRMDRLIIFVLARYLQSNNITFKGLESGTFLTESLHKVFFRNWLAWSRLRQKSGGFCQTKWIFAVRSSATVKKIREVWRKMGLFGPDSVPPNQLLFLMIKLANCACLQHK
jgi:hypothetical protein